MNTKQPRAAIMRSPKKAPASMPPHISVHCKAIKATSAQAKMLRKTHAVAQKAPVAPPAYRPKPKAFTPPKAVQAKMAAPVQAKLRLTPRAPVKPPAFVRPLPVTPGRAVIQRMEDISGSSSSHSSGSEVSIFVPTVSRGALLSFVRHDRAVINVTLGDDQLDGLYEKDDTTVSGSHITFVEYNKGDMRADETPSPRRYCHQNYIEVPSSIRRLGISYVLSYAGALYARDVLRHSHVGTNSVNSNSGKLARGLGFVSKGEIQILPVGTVLTQAQEGMMKHGWRVFGGSLAHVGSSIAPRTTTTLSDRTRLLPDDDPPQSKWCCCFLTTACCRWLGLPDDCEELTLLRHYRDTYVRTSPEGVSAIEHYYEIAPSIATAIDEDQNAKAIYAAVYEVIQQCIDAIKSGDYESVFEQYKQMVLDLEDWYLGRSTVEQF